MSHLENVSEAGIEAMASAGVVGVLLPTTAYILRLHPPPARKMIDNGWYGWHSCISISEELGFDSAHPSTHCPHAQE